MGTILAIATILGGIAAIVYFAEVFYKKRHSQGVAVDHAPLVDRALPEALPRTGQTVSDQPGDSPERRDLPGSLSREAAPTLPRGTASPTDVVQEQNVVEPPPFATALPLEALLKILRDPETTALQKSQFTQREEGRFVVWTGKVHSVDKISESNPKSDLIVVLSPATAGHSIIPDLATAVFPNSEANVLTQLRAGDVVVIEGTLHFHHLARDWSATLTNSRFVRTVERSSSLGS